MTRRVLFVIFFLLSFVTLVILGVWQLQRLTWKNQLIAQITQGLASSSKRYQPHSLPRKEPQTQSRQFTRVTIDGKYILAKDIWLYSPTPSAFRNETQQGYGYFLLNAFQSGDVMVFINRGFVPADLAFRPFPVAIQKSVDGVIRDTESAGLFTPPADKGKGVFYAADIAAMADAAGLNARAIETTEYIDATSDATNTGWPRPRDPQTLLAGVPNRHLEYALTWFALAAALIGVFGTYAVRNRKRAAAQ